MLGYGGHFLTKARRYSTTFKALRETRIAFRRHHDRGQALTHSPAVALVDRLDDDAPLIVGTLTFSNAGWHTTGDALLANSAAALARERQAAGREEIAHELGTTRTTPPIAA
jgi:hypothetical protein